MKNTEQISLGGFAFVIETDAYVQLENYLEDVRECFRNNSSADEIVSDIEIRIAELLKEKYVDGAVVSRAMIEDIKIRIGDPKELAGQDEDDPQEKQEETQSQKRSLRERRLYRDIDDRMLGGVCSGLSHYFNIDKVIFRLFFLIIFCVGLFGLEEGLFSLSIIAYIVLWIAIPGARTVEQKCEMRSKPIDLKDYRTNEKRFSREIKETAESPAVKTGVRVFSMIVGVVLMAIGLSGSIVTVMLPAVPTIGAERFCLDGVGEKELFMIQNILLNNLFWWSLFAVVGLASLGLLYAGTKLCFNLKSPSWRPGLVIFIFWVISILVTFALLFHEIAEIIPSFI
jgi:phage shock protein PspC (stress-responsive transcriptional regulator)